MKMQVFSRLLCFFAGAFFVLWGAPVWADPIVDVHVSSNTVLLGGQAQYSVTVQNTDVSDKGYDLSFLHVFSSDRDDPEGKVTFASASDGSGALAPTTVATDAVTGDTTINFINIKDLAANETYTFNITVDLSGDATWEAMDDIIHDVTVTLNTLPDGNGDDVSDSDQDVSDVLPIALMRKSTNQSTGVEQATGTIDRQYSYVIEVQNNYVNDTDNVIVVDELPDGIEFLGITSDHSSECEDIRADDTGITTITCDLGTMGPGDQDVITFDAGIRYDYFGTDNGGTNRDHDDFDDPQDLGIPIPNKTNFVNHVDLDAQYQGTQITRQSKESSVTAAYATVSKSGSISHGGNGDVIDYAITYTTSEYYEILDDDVDANTSSITLHDLLPDGQTFNDNANPPQTAFIENGDGTTDIYWNSSILDGLDHSDSFTVTFSATVDDFWNNGEPIVGADHMSNVVDSHGEWSDLVDVDRENGMTDSSASAGFGMTTPQITKEVEDPLNPGNWVESVDATVGDQLKFRVRFNTNDGSNPILMNVNLGDIVVTDWLPPGLSYNDDAVMTYSGNDFTGSNYDDDPTAVTIGGLDGLEWNLGDVDQGGWWQAEFTVDVVDVSCVTEGKTANNLWKMTGLNTEGSAYSDRDYVEISYYEPHLVLTKNVNTPNPLLPGSAVEYTLSITNTGSAPARDVVITDQLSSLMRTTTPTITSVDLDGTGLSEGSDYVLDPAYDSGTGVITIDLTDSPTIETEIAGGETLAIVYTAHIDGDVGMYARMINVATVAYNTQHDGTGRTTNGTANTSDDNTDDASMRLTRPTISKNAPAGPYRIGDTIPYTVDVTVPAGHILYWPDILDDIHMDGVSYVTDSAVLSDQSGSPVTSASFSGGTVNPMIDTSGSPRTRLTWSLNNPIDNRGQSSDYVFRLTYNVIYNGVGESGWEFFLPTINDKLDNTANIRWASYNASSRTVQYTRSDNATVDIDQPLLRTTKTTLTSGPYSSGSTIDYQVVIDNIGWATAYDITWEDQLSLYVESYVLSSITHSIGGTLNSGVNFSEDFTGNPLTIDFNGGSSPTYLPVGESITILYSVQVGSDVGAGSSIDNTADVDWSTQPGTGVNERVFDDSSSEGAYTSDTDDVTAPVAQSAFVKSVISPASHQVTIGEEVEYSVRVTVPAETVAYAMTIEDTVTSDGMVYVDGSANIQYVSGNPEIAASIAGTPSFNPTNPTPGATTTFTFNNAIDNSSAAAVTGDTDYVFDVHYRMRATGRNDSGNWVWNPQSTHIVTNTATGRWNDGSIDHTKITPNVDIEIIQPHITTTKDFDTEQVNGGDTIHATVVVENTGSSTAYAYDSGNDLMDVMPDGFFNSHNISLEHSENGTLEQGVDYTIAFFDNDFGIDFITTKSDIAVGENITVTYDVDIDPLIGSGSNISNAFDVDYSSMSGDQSAERDYDDSDSLEGTDDEDSDNVIVELASLDKIVSGDGQFAIGEEFEYSLIANIPESTTVYNAVLTDILPDGLTFLSYDQLTPVGSVNIGAETSGVRQITWNIGDVSNSPVDALRLNMIVRVDDTFDSSLLLDGLPTGVDGDAQDTLTNNAQFAWDDANTGGTAHTANDDETITIVEPLPTLTKSANKTTATFSETVTYTLTVGNDGVSDLYNIVLSDTLDSRLFTASSSPLIASVTHWVDGTLTQGDDYTFDNSANPVTMTFDTGVILGPDETIVVEYVADISDTVVRGDVLDNSARVSSSTSIMGGGEYDREYTTTTKTNSVTIIGPDLTITKDDGGMVIDPGETIIYALDYENIGDASAPDAVITETVPDNTSFDVSTSTSGWICDDVVAGSECAFDLGDVDPSENGSVDFAAIADDPLASGVSVILNTATIADDGTNGADPTPTNNISSASTPISGFVDLTIFKDDAGVGVIQGDGIVYTITYSNEGDQNASGVVITETVPDHTTFDASTSSVGWSCVGTVAGSTCTYAVGSVVGSTSGEIQFSVVSDDPVPSGINEITNTISITDDGIHGPDANSDDNDDTEVTPVIFDPPSAVKTLNAEGIPEIEWKMVWINNGNSSALNVRVIDPIPEGTTYVSGSILCDARGSSTTDVCIYDVPENRVRWIGNIGPDAGNTTEENSDNEVVITFRTRVPDDMREVFNQAEACWDADGDGDYENDCSGGQVPVTTDDPGTIDSDDPTGWIREDYTGDSTIGNYIWHDKNSDGKQDADELGLEDIRVKLTWTGPDGKFGTKDDQVWRTDTDHKGHYIFEDLPEGIYKVQVKDEDVRGWIQTYDPGDTMNGRSIVQLGKNDDHTKADFGYNMTEEKLAQTGDNSMIVVIIGIIFLLITVGMGHIWHKKNT